MVSPPTSAAPPPTLTTPPAPATTTTMKEKLAKLRLSENGQKALAWTVLYFIGYLGWDMRYFLLLCGICYAGRVWHHSKKRPVVPQAPGPPSYKDLPSWVLHPDSQRAQWTNLIVKRLWPHLDQFLVQTLRAVERDPQLRERLAGYHVKSLSFPNATLGQIPPKLGGVKVHKATHRDEIVMDLELQYSGDLLIDLEVVLADLPAYAPPARASISNMAFTGTLRVHMHPLLKDIPFVGGLTVSFLRPPEIDFDLGGLASTLDLPGLNFLLRHVIHDQLEQAVVTPNSISVSLISPEQAEAVKLTSAAEAQGLRPPSGVLSVNLVEAKDLVNKDITLLGQGKSDPYAKLRIVADGMAHTFKTETIDNNLHPVWKLLIDLPVDDPDTLDDLKIDVWDEDKGNKDDFLGKCVVPVHVLRTAITSYQTQDVWRKLEKIKKGSFHAEVTWSELRLEPPEIKDDNHRGVLTVMVDSCSNLLSGQTGVKLPCTSVRVEVCGIFQVTDEVVGSSNPVFAHRMNFLVRNAAADALRITVVDTRDGEEVLGKLRFSISKLMERPNRAMANQQFNLTGKLHRGDKTPGISLSMCYRFIHRPHTSSYGVHKSLQELHKIMGATVRSKADLVAGLANAAVPNGDAAPAEKEGGKGRRPPSFGVNDDSIRFIDASDSERANNNNEVHNNNYNNNMKDNKNLSQQPPYVDNRYNQPPSSYGNNVNNSNVLNGNTTPNLNQNKPFPGTNEDPDFVHRRGFGLHNSLPPTSAPPSTPPDSRPKLQLSLKYSTRTLALSVVAHRARNLQETVHTSMPNPYVKTYLIESVSMGSNRRIAHSKRKTRVQRHSVNPVFEETLEYFLPPQTIRQRRLEVTVCSDRGVLGRNLVLGRCIVSLDAVHDSVTAIALKNDVMEASSATITDWHILQLSGLGHGHHGHRFHHHGHHHGHGHHMSSSQSAYDDGTLPRSLSGASSTAGSSSDSGTLTRRTRKQSGSRGSLTGL